MIDLMTVAHLKGTMKNYADSMPMTVKAPGDRRAVAAQVEVIGGELVITLSYARDPSLEETAAALNAGMVEGEPEAA